MKNEDLLPVIDELSKALQRLNCSNYNCAETVSVMMTKLSMAAFNLNVGDETNARKILGIKDLPK
jgi:hypothetical protein